MFFDVCMCVWVRGLFCSVQIEYYLTRSQGTLSFISGKRCIKQKSGCAHFHIRAHHDLAQFNTTTSNIQDTLIKEY